MYKFCLFEDIESEVTIVSSYEDLVKYENINIVFMPHAVYNKLTHTVKPL